MDKPILNTPLEYFVKRWKRFNPKYIGAILITYLIIVFPNVVKGKAGIKEILGVFPDFLMLQSVGIFNDMGGQNKPLWYLSVLLFGGTIIYSFLFCNKRVSINIILPIICLLGYTYFNQGTLDYKIENWKINGFVYEPLLRGICDISVGVLLGYVVNQKRKFLDEHSMALNICSVISFILIAYLCFSELYFDNIAILFLVILIAGCFSKTSVFHKIFYSKLWIHLGGTTYSMLLLHFPILVVLGKIIYHFNVGCKYEVIIYVILVLISSLLYDRVFKKLKV